MIFASDNSHISATNERNEDDPGGESEDFGSMPKDEITQNNRNQHEIGNGIQSGAQFTLRIRFACHEPVKHVA